MRSFDNFDMKEDSESNSRVEVYEATETIPILRYKNQKKRNE